MTRAEAIAKAIEHLAASESSTDVEFRIVECRTAEAYTKLAELLPME